MTILGKMNDAISEPRSELSPYAPRISAIQIDTEKIGAVIGKGGETIRALSEEFDAQIDIDDDGTVRIYAQTGEQGDALVDRIRSMTKEVELGDEFTGKVVKTTTFGAFVELAKGTDGLIHISNIAPGQRPNTVEEVVNRGDELRVKVVEVDRERGRIGLRLADDPEIAGKTPEELAAMGTGDKGGRGDRGNGRGGRGAATTAARRTRPRPRRTRRTRPRPWRPQRPRPGPRAGRQRVQHRSQQQRVVVDRAGPGHNPEIRRASRDRGDALGPLDRAGLLGPGRLARRGPRARRASRTSWSTCSSRARTASARARSTRPSTRWAPRSTPAPARRPPRSTRASSTTTWSARSTCSRTWCCGRRTRTSTPSARW